MVYSGMTPDSRVLVRKARKKAQSYYRTYQDTMPTSQNVKEVAAVMQEFTQVRQGAACSLISLP